MSKNVWGRHSRENIDTARARFLARTRPDPSGCLIWTGAIGSHKRYGICSVVGRQWLAHRAAWFLFKSEDPGDATICHTCDNGFCVNVEHLFKGTQGDNVRDMENKGRARHPTGERHGRAKLTAEDVCAIRAAHKDGASIRSLARKYKVAKTSIARIVHGTGWLYVK